MKPNLEKVINFFAGLGFSESKPRILPDSKSSFTPGFVYNFVYNGANVTVICVSTRRAKNGNYISNRGNPLVTCIKLDTEERSLYNVGTELILKNILNRQRQAKYQEISKGAGLPTRLLSRFFSKFKDKVRKKTVLSLFGKSNFRTYNISKINIITKIEL